MSKNVLVTGAAGFIGANFAEFFVNKHPEYNVIVLDKLTYAGNLETLKPIMENANFKFVKGDIADRAFVFDLFEKEKFDDFFECKLMLKTIRGNDCEKLFELLNKYSAFEQYWRDEFLFNLRQNARKDMQNA